MVNVSFYKNTPDDPEYGWNGLLGFNFLIFMLYRVVCCDIWNVNIKFRRRQNPEDFVIISSFNTSNRQALL